MIVSYFNNLSFFKFQSTLLLRFSDTYIYACIYNYWAMITEPKIMRKKKKKPQPIPQPEPQLPKTKEYFVKKCQEFLQEMENKIIEQIGKGETNIRQTPLHIEFEKIEQESSNLQQKDIKDKLNSLNHDLESLQNEIVRQKEEEKKRQESKRKQAKILIERLKKEKEQHRNRIKFNEISSRLKDNVYSDDVLRMMKQHRENLVKEKKRDMELKIYEHLNRKQVREEANVKNQVSYWVKIQQIQSRKRYHSTKALPKLQNVSKSQQPDLGINNSYNKNIIIPRKNTHSLHIKSKSKPDILEYPEIVQRFLERAKAKQENKSEKSPLKSRVMTNGDIPENIEEVSISNNEKIDKIVLSQADNKRKMLGDQYLKESLLRVKSPTSMKKQDENHVEDNNFELKANPVSFSRNDRLSNLEERRNKILQNLLKEKIQKSLAIEMLHPIDNKLDRIHPSGIQDRLKYKLEMFQRHQQIKNPNNHSVITYQDQLDQSSEHGI